MADIKKQFSKIIEKIQDLPQEDQIAYGAMIVGVLLILISIITW